MLRDETTEAAATPPPPCAVCGRSSVGDWWDAQLCGSCFSAWSLQGPALEAAKLAHADKHPGDVALRGELKYLTDPKAERRWVTLHSDASVRVTKAFAAAWLLSARKAAA